MKGGMKKERKTGYSKIDLVKDILITLAVILLLFAYWVSVLLILSLLLMNVWRIRWQQIVWIALGLTVVSGTVYTLRLVIRRRRGE